jgi:putative two-component system response regulator
MGGERPTIMLVDDNMTSLTMGKNILQEQYKVYTIPSGVKLFDILAKISPDLILLDIEMPDMDGFKVIKRLKENKETADIPVIFLTSHNDTDNELVGLSLGAIDYISKPFSPPLLTKRIENHLLIEDQKKELKLYNDHLQEMVNEQTACIEDLQYTVMSIVSEVVEFREKTIGGHIVRIQKYLKCLVDALLKARVYEDELSTWDLRAIIPSAQLHDVGKILISEKILNKQGKLTPEEFNNMKKHTEFGVWIIERIMQYTKQYTFLEHAKIFAGTHHEKWDGSGYPLGLRGEAIPLHGRILAIVDVYDTLIAERPYKHALSAPEAENIILEEKGAHFDPLIVDVFQDVALQFANIAAFPDLSLPVYITRTHPNLLGSRSPGKPRK